MLLGFLEARSGEEFVGRIITTLKRMHADNMKESDPM